MSCTVKSSAENLPRRIPGGQVGSPKNPRAPAGGGGAESPEARWALTPYDPRLDGVVGNPAAPQRAHPPQTGIQRGFAHPPARGF